MCNIFCFRKKIDEVEKWRIEGEKVGLGVKEGNKERRIR